MPANPFGSGVPVLQRKSGAALNLAARGAGGPGPLAVQTPGSVMQAMKRLRDESDTESSEEDGEDEDYTEPKKGKKQPRYNFRAGSQKRVIKATAHRAKHIDATRFQAVWTCPNCKRQLAYKDLAGTFHLTQYGYLSQGGNHHSLAALAHDHHPETWADRLLRHQKQGDTNDVIRQSYQDETNLRALCKKCNESHEHENEDLSDYDSSEDDFDPPTTPPHETTYNSGQFSGYRPAGFV
jgi:hypothetical protein